MKTYLMKNLKNENGSEKRNVSPDNENISTHGEYMHYVLMCKFYLFDIPNFYSCGKYFVTIS